jgi:hypothetical protein
MWPHVLPLFCSLVSVLSFSNVAYPCTVEVDVEGSSETLIIFCQTACALHGQKTRDLVTSETCYDSWQECVQNWVMRMP